MEINGTADNQIQGDDKIINPRRRWSHKKQGTKIKKKKKKKFFDKSVQTISESSIESTYSNIEPFWDRYG